ncbi:low molecular weight phosphotyrosine protein phosphatase [Nocardioides mangrovicus]|uniref:protein-tyrosine-phosphatase n=2 Tax=Nocardioides mangrovicus TaxID=2478913 RepID=A0A3L8NZQ0_9ACTN|nr:low molecular weight phosphotyrosine protein phosphatase [Nocardioides mangrovicus]
MAHVVLEHQLVEAGLTDAVEVSSCGTGGWHVGDPMDHRAAATLRAAGYDPDRHRARQLDADWADRDLLLAMDATNLADVRALLPEADVRLFRELDPVRDAGGPGDVPDPYFGGDEGFAEVLAMVERTCEQIVSEVAMSSTLPGGQSGL